MTPVGRGHWCNGQNGEEEENALHPGFGDHSETKNGFQEKREDAGLEDTGWVRLLEGKKGTDRQRGGFRYKHLETHGKSQRKQA